MIPVIAMPHWYVNCNPFILIIPMGHSMVLFASGILRPQVCVGHDPRGVRQHDGKVMNIGV